MSRIKYTIVPKENIEASIFESGVRLSETDLIIDPIVVFNANMELGIETEIYGNDISNDNFRFTKESNLLNILTEVNDAEMTNTIIVNGFDIDLDYVHKHITKLANKSDKIYSINVISDKRKYTNFTINLDSEENIRMTDEEWEQFKIDFEENFKESLSQDVESNKLSRSTEDTEKAVEELLKAVLGVTDEDIEKDEDGMLTIELKENKPAVLPAPKKIIDVKPTTKTDYESYSYANNDGMVTIEQEDGMLIFMDEENEIVVPVEFKDFIIETLKKLK